IISPCIYCGLSCKLKYQVENEKIVGIAGDANDEVSGGQPCIKGLTIKEVTAKNRNLEPQIRKNGNLRKASWDEAYDFILQNTKDLAPQELFFCGSGKTTNEDNYVLQKFARLVFKTNNIDSCCTRLCHAPTVMAMQDCFGTSNLTCLKNLEKIDSLLIFGSNPASNYPVFWNKVLAEKRRRALAIIIVQPMYSLTSKTVANAADTEIIFIEPGSEVAFLNGIINYLLQNRAYFTKAEKYEGFARLKEIVKTYSPELVEKITKVEKSKFLKLCQVLGKSKVLGVFHGMGLTQHINGIENIHSLLNLMLLKNGFILTLRGEVNVQGVGDMACEPTAKPDFAKVWNADLPLEKGKNLIEAFLIEPVKAAFISGFNPAQSLPNLNRVHKILSTMFLVQMEAQENLTSQFANVILPIPLLCEREGTVTSGERRVRKVNQVVKPPGEVKSEWQIYQELAKLLAKEEHFSYSEPKEIFREIIKSIPDYQNLEVESIWAGADGWPKKEIKFQRFYPEKFEGCDDPRSKKYPFILTTFRSPFSFLTNEVTENSETLKKMEKRPSFHLNPADAETLRIKNEDKVKVESVISALTAKALLDSDIPKGLIAAHFHSRKLLVNKLFPLEFDEESFIPNFKATAVKVEKVRPKQGLSP
ncbi:MAG: molybdopterin-dependent oxidoreductase, partial [Candidatus Cloacimonetes bacterium]|nr:molybdopterin-dependent oxidoreductase [Candidatus Cloacimonadota bacterium]